MGAQEVNFGKPQELGGEDIVFGPIYRPLI
jgi:hypothetical protein